ncbi:MAG: hypothetical protein Q9213_002977 [Squamulea squamosa]
MATQDFAEGYVMTRSDKVPALTKSDLQHKIWLLTLDGHLTTASLPNGAGHVLDIGTGTGAWALAIAKQFPAKQIIATDLTPPSISPPSNVTFVKANADDDWAFGQRFSFIHGRMLASGIHNWPRLLEQCFSNLEPGGRVELLDICHPFQVENNVATSESDSHISSDFLRWGQVAEKCWALVGLDYRATTKHMARFRDLGFVDVYETVLRWPLGAWPAEEKEKKLGELTLRNFITFLTAAGKNIIKQHPCITDQEANKLVTAALKDLRENNLTKKFSLTM